MNWSKILLEAVTFGLDEIPVVGSLLEHIAYALWPENDDVWDQIKDEVENLVKKEISSEVYNRVETSIGSRKDMDGLIGTIQEYLTALDHSTFEAVNVQFIKSEAAFKEKGYELLLLPLFTQFANLHLTLLRDGVIKGWKSADYIQERIDLYTEYIDQQYKKAVEDREKNQHGNYNFLNVFRRKLITDVLNFRDTWKVLQPCRISSSGKDELPKGHLLHAFRKP